MNAKSQMNSRTIRTNDSGMTFNINPKPSHRQEHRYPLHKIEEKSDYMEICFSNRKETTPFLPKKNTRRFNSNLKPIVDIFLRFGECSAYSAKYVFMAKQLAISIKENLQKKTILREANDYSNVIKHIAGVFIDQLLAMYSSLESLMQINQVLGIEVEGIINYEDHFIMKDKLSKIELNKIQGAARKWIDELIKYVNRIDNSGVYSEIKLDLWAYKHGNNLEKSIKNKGIGDIMRQILNNNDEDSSDGYE